MSRKSLSPGKVGGKAIDRLELRQTPAGAEVTIFYKYHFLENAADTFKAHLTIPHNPAHTISDYFFEVGLVLGLELKKGQNVDWKSMKDIPDEYCARPDFDPNNVLHIIQAPGALFWVAEGVR